MRSARQTAARCILAAGLFCVSAAATAQVMDDFEEDAAAADRKRPGLLTRAARPTPEAQLAYARELEAGGRIRGAMKQYAALVMLWHDAPQAPEAQLAYARLLEKRGKYLKAFEEYQYLVDQYAGQFPYEDVVDRQFRIANLVMNRRWGRVLFLPGFRSPERALPLFEQVVRNAPGGERAARARFYIGLVNEQIKDLDAAIRAYETVYHRFPGNPFAAEAAFRRAVCLYRMARASPRDEARCRRALSALAVFLRDFPESPNRPDAQRYRDALHADLVLLSYEKAVYYDRIAQRPEAARIAYNDFIKRFPLSEQAREARERMEVLEQQLEGQSADEE
ncbi:MAG: tetratricopeptide repeat protein [Lentisphaerae bacterium]|nr:tetratricopeptide repeat protein [Lentisphaerota bacterium]